jgi:hypothetical protein
MPGSTRVPPRFKLTLYFTRVFTKAEFRKSPEQLGDEIVSPAGQSFPEDIMKKLVISFALGTSALFATAASAAPPSNGITTLPDGNIENVRMVCNENGRCWQERSGRRVIIRERDSYDYAPRERYIERRGYYDEPRPGIGFSAPGVSVGIGRGW